MRFSLAAPAALLALASSSLCASVTIEAGKLSIVDSATSIARKSVQFSTGNISPLELSALSSDDLLRLAFELKDSQTSAAVVPEQVSVLWQVSPSNGEEWTVRNEWLAPIKVRKSGKAKWELDLSRAPIPFLTLGSAHPVSLKLIVAGEEFEPQMILLGTFEIPESVALPFPYPPDEDLPKSWEVDKYSIQPEMFWTFREPVRGINPVLALGGTALVLAPWLVLVSIFKALSLKISAPTGWRAVFLVAVIAFEALIFTYWIGLKLIPTLPVFGALAVFTAWSGRRALGEVRQIRLREEGKAKKAE